MRIHAAVTFAALATVTACDQPLPDPPAVDASAPRVHITSPVMGTILGDVTAVDVVGTVTDTDATSVTVNDIEAKLDANGNFAVSVPVDSGTNLLHAVATDAVGHTGKETRAVVAGAKRTLAGVVPAAISATISAPAFAAIGRGAGALLRDADMTALLTPLNPIADSGSDNGRPDCLYAQANVRTADIGDADIRLTPQSGGLALDARLTDVRATVRAQWAVACLDGGKTLNIKSGVRLTGFLSAAVDNANRIRFTLNNPQITLTNFDVDMSGIPGDIVDMLSLDRRIAPLIANAAEDMIGPKLDEALAGLTQTKSLDVLGKKLDVTVFPSRLSFDEQGLAIRLDAELRAQGDQGTFVFEPNQVPAMDRSRGVQLAIADDAANQLLTSFWSAKGMELGIDLTTGPYGQIGELYDRVSLSAAVPPYIDASGTGLRLTIGDLIATFESGGEAVTKVAVNAELALEARADLTTGALLLDVGSPTTYVDILDENVAGTNALSTSQFEAITSFALSRVVSVGSGAVGAIPLPTAGGVGVHQLVVGEQTGYLVVTGEIQ